MTYTEVVLDSSAWIEYFQGTGNALDVEHYLNDKKCLTLSITVAEVVAKFIKSKENPELAVEAMRTLSKVVSASEDIAINAGKLYVERRKKRKKFALSDAFILALAKREKARILTKDTDFCGIKESILLSN